MEPPLERYKDKAHDLQRLRGAGLSLLGLPTSPRLARNVVQRRISILNTRVAVVTDELVGINRGGGIGTCANGLIRLLISTGHDVDVIITDPSYKVENYSFYGARVRSLAIWVEKRHYKPVDHVVFAYGVYEMLREENYASVHFNDWRGSGYFYAMAKRQGIVDATIISHAHGPLKWVRTYNLGLADIDITEMEALERFQVENSDHVVCPSAYLLDWYAANGTKLPASHVINWILPEWLDRGVSIFPDPLHTKSVPPRSITELVFFGRQERRKGFDLFLEAIKSEPRLRNIDLTFLGRFDRIDREFTGSRVFRLLANHGGAIKFLNNLDHDEAFSFLERRTQAIAVMPSSIENSPCTVGECLTMGLPFLATAVGGTPELFEGGDLALTLVPNDARALADRLVSVIEDGMPEVRSRLSPVHIVNNWTDFLESLRQRPSRAAPLDRKTLVSVCLVHHNRPTLLRRALSALALQTYKYFEVVLVDDGSNQAALRQLDNIEAEDWPFSLRVLRTKNKYLGAARNLAARNAAGYYLIFHDDDNISEPDQIEKFVAAAENGNYDILTSQYYVFRDDQDPRDGKIMYFPMGVGGAFSFFRNRFGDANAIVRKSAFEMLGGFSELTGVGWEDWELFLRAHIARLEIGLIPEPLFKYRTSSDGMLSSTSPIRNHARITAAVAAASPPVSADLLEIAKKESIEQFALDHTWSLLARSKFANLHQELTSVDPNSEETKYKLMELAFAMGRKSDAIEIGLGLDRGFQQVVALLSAVGPRARFAPGAISVSAITTAYNEIALIAKGWLQPTDTRLFVPDALVRNGVIFKIVHWLPELRDDVNLHIGCHDLVSRGFRAVALAETAILPAGRSSALLRRGEKPDRNVGVSLTGPGHNSLDLLLPDPSPQPFPIAGWLDDVEVGQLFNLTYSGDPSICYNGFTITTDPGRRLFILRSDSGKIDETVADSEGVCSVRISPSGENEIKSADIGVVRILVPGQHPNLSACFYKRA